MPRQSRLILQNKGPEEPRHVLTRQGDAPHTCSARGVKLTLVSDTGAT